MDRPALEALERDGYLVLPGVLSAHLLHRGSRNRSAHPRPSLQLVWRAG